MEATTALRQTLLLSREHQPVKIIPWQRAVTLLFLGKVEVLEDYADDGAQLRSTTWVMKIPAVVRLVKLFRRDKKKVKFSRTNIYGRDHYKCQYCGNKKKISELTYDHVVPRSQGGKTVWTNIVTACVPCNARKGGRTPEQAGMKLITQPRQLTEVPNATFHVPHRSTPEEWRSYLYWTGELEHDDE